MLKEIGDWLIKPTQLSNFDASILFMIWMRIMVSGFCCKHCKKK